MGFLDRFRAGIHAATAPRATGPDPTGGLADATPTVRTLALGHGPQYQTSNHADELGHNTGWSAKAVQAIGYQWSQADVRVFDTSAERTGKSLSPFGRFVTKGATLGTTGERRTPLPNHPAARLLKRPNPMKSGAEWMYQVAQQFTLTGGYVIWEVKNQLGQPMELWVLPRGWLQYQVPTERFPMGTWRVYPTRMAGGSWSGGVAGLFSSGFFLDVRETIIGGTPNPLVPGEYTGMMEAGSRIIDIAEQADEATWNALVEAPRPGMILSVNAPGTLTPTQLDSIGDEVRKSKGGSSNVGKVLVLQHVTREDLGTPLSELSSVEVREQARKFTMMLHGVPELAMGGAEGNTYSGNAAISAAWAEYGLQPPVSMFAAVLTHRFQKYWGNDFEIEIEVRRSDDPTLDLQRTDKLLAMYKEGIATGNEVRATMKLPPKPELDELKEPEPAPVPGQMPGQPGAPGGADDSDDLDLTVDDLGDDEPGETDTGTADPNRAGMPRDPASKPRWAASFSRNGSAAHAN